MPFADRQLSRYAMLSTSTDKLAINVIAYSGFRIFAAHLYNVSQLKHPNVLQDGAQSSCEEPNVLSQLLWIDLGGRRRSPRMHAIKRIDPAALTPTRAPSGGLIHQQLARVAQMELPTTLLRTRDQRLRAFSSVFFEPDRDLTAFAFRIHNSQCD